MVIYAIIIGAVVVLSSIAIIYLLKKKNILNIRIIVSIVMSSIIISFLFPFLLGAVSETGSFGTAGIPWVLSLLATFVIYILLVFLFAVIISMLISNLKILNFFDKFKKILSVAGLKKMVSKTQKLLENVEKSVDSEQNTDKIGLEGKYVEKCTDNLDFQDSRNLSDENIYGENLGNEVLDNEVLNNVVLNSEVLNNKALNNEVSNNEALSGMILDGKNDDMDLDGLDGLGGLDGVDLFDNTDLDRLNFDSANAEEIIEKEIEGATELGMEIGLDECIEEAFALKEKRDLEGAILYYMYALDKNPEEELAFWIILDICALYKTLGQIELAREILENYANVMDESVKAEIERNLYYS